jgi:hypothetical protein
MCIQYKIIYFFIAFIVWNIEFQLKDHGEKSGGIFFGDYAEAPLGAPRLSRCGSNSIEQDAAAMKVMSD